MKHSKFLGRLIFEFFLLERYYLYCWRRVQPSTMTGDCRWPDSNRHGPFKAQRILSPYRYWDLGTVLPLCCHSWLISESKFATPVTLRTQLFTGISSFWKTN